MENEKYLTKIKSLKKQQQKCKDIINSKKYSKAEIFKQVMKELNITFSKSKGETNFIDKKTLKLKNFLNDAFDLDLDIFSTNKSNLKNYSSDVIHANILMEIFYQLLNTNSNNKNEFINKLSNHSYDKITRAEIKDFINNVAARLEKEFEKYIANEPDCPNTNNTNDICGLKCKDFFSCEGSVKMSLKAIIKNFKKSNINILDHKVKINAEKEKTLNAIEEILNKTTYSPILPFAESYIFLMKDENEIQSKIDYNKTLDGIILSNDEKLFFLKYFYQKISNTIDEYKEQVKCYMEAKDDIMEDVLEESPELFYDDNINLIEKTFKRIINLK